MLIGKKTFFLAAAAGAALLGVLQTRLLVRDIPGVDPGVAACVKRDANSHFGQPLQRFTRVRMAVTARLGDKVFIVKSFSLYGMETSAAIVECNGYIRTL